MSNEEEIIEVLREILKWIRFSGLENVRNELRRVLDTDKKRLVYSLSDGQKTSREIAKVSGVSDFTVRNWWSEWFTNCIVDPKRVRGGTRYVKSFNLEKFGLILPEMEQARAANQQKEPSKALEEQHDE
ncbi:MAG: hypothetical protein NWE89_10235 [Candidatus Bathyarchaeota archaeon]|nr:hypothetical protein [Candidatus Bathyarchaeota archaeon]